MPSHIAKPHARVGRTLADRPAASVAVGRNVGRWELVEHLVGGELSDIYLARSTGGRNDRRPAYALKQLRTVWEDDPRVVELIRNEAEVGQRIRSEHLVPILDAQLRQPPYYVVMPRLDGCDLASILKCNGPLPIAQALWFARQVAEALDALYAQGWMHGDIKPSNVMVSPVGHVTLIDLTFARRIEIRQRRDESRLILGTPHYVAPEAFVSTLAPDIRSDIYSLGVMLYEMLAGRRPLHADQLGELITQHCTKPPRPVRTCNPQIPPAVERLVHRMLAKQPIRRPQTPRELIDDLIRAEIDTFAHR